MLLFTAREFGPSSDRSASDVLRKLGAVHTVEGQRNKMKGANNFTRKMSIEYEFTYLVK